MKAFFPAMFLGPCIFPCSFTNTIAFFFVTELVNPSSSLARSFQNAFKTCFAYDK